MTDASPAPAPPSPALAGAPSSGDRPDDFARYGLLAALTLVILALLLADRVRSARPAAAAPSPDRRLQIEIGGYDSTRAASGAARSAVPSGPARVAPPAPPGPAPRPAPAVARTCVVAPGETLGDIARRELGSARRAPEIAEANGLRDVNQIRAGQSLRLPPR